MKMKRTGTALLAAMAILTVLDMAQGAAHASDLPKWSCNPSGPAAIDSDVVREITSTPLMMRVLQEYRARWDAEYIRQQCDAAAAGQSADISCLKGRRDWDAIQAMVPSELEGGDRSAIGNHLAALQQEDDGLRTAFAHCRDLGVIK